MSLPTLRQLEYFVATVDTGSVTAAADRCSASQAAVSTALTELERTIGLQLLSRRAAKGAVLTPSGARVLPIARRILDDVDELMGAADAEHGEVAGPLRLACTYALAPRVLPPLAAAFAAQHPRVDLQLVDGLAREVQELVRSGSADAAILYARQLGPGLRSVTVRTAVPHVVLAANHPRAEQPAIALLELARERLIVVNRERSQGVIEAIIAEAGGQPESVWAFSNPETVLAMVAHGLGYSIFSARGSREGSVDGHQLRFIPLADAVTPNEIVLATPDDRPRTARLEALEQLLLSDALQWS